jgi:hypothetical protein
MHPEVHRYLDGELPRSALSQAAAMELAAWEKLEGGLVERRGDRAPSWLADDVMRAVAGADVSAPAPAHNREAAPLPKREGLRGEGWQARGAPAPRRPWQRAWQWLVTPRPLQVRPLAPLAAAAALVLVILAQGPGTEGGTPLVADAAGEEPVIYVQFTLSAAGARTVSVAGDFNDWSVEAGTLRDVDGSGQWRGLIAVRPGVHKYMFVVDGEEWVTDPSAERYVDDGFGMRNALLAVVQPGAAL